MAIVNIKWASVAVGAGAAVLGTTLLPALGGALKSMTKTLIKTSLLTYEGSKGLMDRTAKTIEHIASEAKAELNDDGRKQPTAKKATAKSASRKKRTQKEMSQQKSARQGSAG